MAEQTYFQKAMSDFVFDVASAGAIRHLTDLGYTVKKIQEQLDFPTPYEKIQKTVWEYLVDTGVILLEKPEIDRGKEKVRYVREYDSYGKPSFRRVVEVEAVSGASEPFLTCEFGLLRYKNQERFQEVLKALNQSQAEYIDGLPWEKRKVYHRPDQRMLEIFHRLQAEGVSQGICYYEDEEGDINQCAGRKN